jgi:predicted nucleic acid-binding protein
VFVIDASVTMAWCFADEATAATESLLDQFSADEAVVPAVWPLEVANVLLVAERRRRLTEAQASRFLDLLQQLPISVDEDPTDLAAVVAAGRRHELSSYDASYLVLAERTGAPLATLDRRLADAASRAGVRLLATADPNAQR